ncbi:hypothetical protein BpHYR1_025612 [Brachionus plicatilis]|uniref:Uncharacterized protein n=1 Tax=Brachionus plicatilis TaxID=10195 RepID=A0A3M7STR0_BRAPC|nr:hypothetical protein BpHYR1_025612 [Brachionus plicatilis]
MESDIEAVLVPHWKGLEQGQHTESQKKVSEYLKSVQTVLENLANKVKMLEKDNFALNRENESLRNKLDKGQSSYSGASAEKWSNFLKKGSLEKSSHEEVMIVEKMFEESRLKKANNVVISGVPTQNADDKNDEQIVSDILEVTGIQNTVNKVKRVFRLAKSKNQAVDNKPPPIVVELCDKETQTRLFKNAKKLKDNVHPDLTRNEMEIERELRRRRNLENDKLNLGEGRLKYGELENWTRFYWGIRFGKLCRIDRETKRALPLQ